MKRYKTTIHLLLVGFMLVCLPALMTAEKDIIIEAMTDEMNRSMKSLQIENMEKPYYLGYTIIDNRQVSIEAVFGSLTNSSESHHRSLWVDLRVGSYQLDNTALGFEYQILDDDNHADGANPTHRTAGLYDIIPPKDKKLKPVGEFNQSKIIFNENQGEHWLNGAKVLEYNLGTATMDSLISTSKYKIFPGFGNRRKGHIVLQDHTDDVWYRNLKLKILN